MPELMWSGTFSNGRILISEKVQDSIKFADCNSEDDFDDLVFEVYEDYDYEPPIWSTRGLCIVNGEEVSVDEISKKWSEVEFYEKYKDKISSHLYCAVCIDNCKGYSHTIEIETFDPSLLRYESGLVFYGDDQFIPECYRGTGGEKTLFKYGERVIFEY